MKGTAKMGRDTASKEEEKALEGAETDILTNQPLTAPEFGDDGG